MGFKSIVVGIVAAGAVTTGIMVANTAADNALPAQQWSGNVSTNTGAS